MASKQWKVTYPDITVFDEFTSKTQTYDWLRVLKNSHDAVPLTAPLAHVWSRSGSSVDWTLVETVDFNKYSTDDQ